MNFDENMSVMRNEACSFCHMPQRYTYSPYFPALQFNATQGLFFGGNFWDSRATGYLLRLPDSEQAQHPPVDPAEMGLPDTACIAFRLSQAPYRPLFELIWGSGSFDIKFPNDTETICSTPAGTPPFADATPIPLSPEDRTHANSVYNHWGESLNAYEHSLRVSPFTSKFDAFLAGNATLTADEIDGYNLFKGKATAIHATSTEEGPLHRSFSPTTARRHW